MEGEAWRQGPPSWPPRPGQASPLAKSECTRHILAQREKDTTQLKGWTRQGPHLSHWPMRGQQEPLSCGFGKRDLVSQAGGPCPGGCVSTHRWSSAVMAGHRQNVIGGCESGQRGGLQPSWGRRPPTHPTEPGLLGRMEAARPSSAQGSGHSISLGVQSHCQAEEGPACQTGAPQLPSALRPFPPAPPGRC